MFTLAALIIGGVAAFAIVRAVRGAVNAAGSGSTSTAGPVGRPPAPVAAPTNQGGRTTMKQGQSKMQRIVELQALIKADGSTGKTATKAEQTELATLARDVSAELKLPVYPIGMEARFADKWVKILNAWQNGGAGPWSYQIDAKLGMLFGVGDGTHTVTETEIRSRLSDALGAMGPGQAYPRGIQIARNRVGGLVESATQDPKTGEWTYGIRGWPAPVAQSELTAAMRAA